MRRIDHIVIHCSATPEGRDVKIGDIRRWHTDPKPVGNGWSDIGYHFVIELDGTTQPGRPLEIPGAHVGRPVNYNPHSIGICYVGGIDANGDPKDTRTIAQRRSMTNLVVRLHGDYPEAEILGHRDFPGVAKACPSFPVKDWWAGKY